MIDWSKPIELDTVPPRPARLVLNDGTEHMPMQVAADWDDDGTVDTLWLTRDGFWGAYRVRNVTTPTDDVTAELLKALKACAAYLQDEAGGSDEVLMLLANATAAIVKAEARS